MRALFIQNIISLSVACMDLPYFFTFSHKLHRLWTKVIEYKICILISCTKFCETCLILRRNERDIIINAYRSSCNVSIISFVFYRRFNFLNIFSKNISESKFHENLFCGGRDVPCRRTEGRTNGAESIKAERRTICSQLHKVISSI